MLDDVPVLIVGCACAKSEVCCTISLFDAILSSRGVVTYGVYRTIEYITACFTDDFFLILEPNLQDALRRHGKLLRICVA